MNNTKNTNQSTSATPVAPEKNTKARRNKPGRNNTKPGRSGRGGTPNPNAPASPKRVEWLAPQLDAAKRRISGLGRDIDRNRSTLVEAGHQADIDKFEAAVRLLEAASLDGATNAHIDAVKAAIDAVFAAGRAFAEALPKRDSKRDGKRNSGLSFGEEVERLRPQVAKAAEVAARDLAKITGAAGDAWRQAIIAAGIDPVEAGQIVDGHAAYKQAQVDWAKAFENATVDELKSSGYNHKTLGSVRVSVNAVFNEHREWIEASQAVKV